MKDIRSLCYDMIDGDFDDIKNKYLKTWAKNFRDRFQGSTNGKLCATYGLIENSVDDIGDDSAQEAINWLKPKKIHKDFHWNDAMYTNSFDISWSFWGKAGEWEDIIEWVVFIKDNDIFTPTAFVLVNRNMYSPIDQMIIHKLIETSSKKNG